MMNKRLAASTHSMMDQMSIGILIFDEKDLLVYMNDAAQEILDISERKGLGIRASKLIDSPLFSFQQGLDRCREHRSKVTEHVVPIGGPYSIKIKRNISLTMTPLDVGCDANGDILVEMIDLNHYLQINQEEKLISQNQLATNMLRGLAHEIKNPLGGLRGAAQLLSQEIDHEYQDYLDVIIDEADRLRNLLDRMLGSAQKPKREATNIHIILERVRQLAIAEAAPGVSIKTDYDPSIPEIIIDKDQLIQAQLNIVRNALQAVNAEGTITLKTRIHRNFTIGEDICKMAIKIDVIDDGDGIPEEMLTKIFYPMVTGRDDGTGLGLSIAQTNVQRHNGIIEVESVKGKTVFSTILPLELNHG